MHNMMIYSILYTQLECKNLNMVCFTPDSESISSTQKCFNNWYITCYKDKVSSFKNIDEIKQSMIEHIDKQFI